MTNKSKQSDNHVAEAIGVGIGLTAAAVAAAGAFFLYGSKNAAKNRKLVKSWALKAKAEVLEKLETAKEMTQAEYETLVEQVVGAYATAQTATKKDIKELQAELKSHWKGLVKAAPKPKSKKAPVKKAVKKTSAATAKKAPVKRGAKKPTVSEA